ncbi:MAG: pyruvate synthase [Fimbriimonadia bacterium]
MTLLTHKTAEQKVAVLSGNYAAAEAIAAIGYDLEGFYPITPSSEVGEAVAAKIAKGELEMVFVPANSELAAIGVCTGAAAAGARAVDVTSSQGLLLKFEELPVLSGLRLPMVMNIAARAVSAPLNIKCDHSDFLHTLGTGWLILLANNVQEVYDMNIIALKWAERVSLPAMVVYDGFFTSHGTRRIEIFANRDDVKAWVGPKPPRPSILDIHNPKTFGPYMNDDLINNKYQLHLAMKEAMEVIPGILEDYAAFSGRKYDVIDTYRMEDKPETVMFSLCSASETVCDAVDKLREKGEKVGSISLRVLRPFPSREVADAFKDAKTALIAERADQYGGPAGWVTNEIATVLQEKRNHCRLLTRVYGLGGLIFTWQDAEKLFEQAMAANRGEDVPKFDYYGHWPGSPEKLPPKRFEPEDPNDFVVNEGLGERVNIQTLRTLASDMPHRIAHPQSCPGCGAFVNLDIFLSGIDGPTVLLFNTGCGMVVTTGFPDTSFRVPYMHNLFHNNSSTAVGIVETYRLARSKGLITEETTVIAVGGDGSGDIGLDQLLSAAIRNHPFIYFEYDNNVYANTGAQLCYTAPKGLFTTTSPGGKGFHHKDMIELMRGTHCRYIVTIAETHVEDAIRKARKAQQMVRDGNFVFAKSFSACPLNWVTPDWSGPQIVQKALDSCFFPLLEIENGITKLNYDPEALGKKIPVDQLFGEMGKAGVYLRGENHAQEIADLQAEVDRRWRRLKAMHEDPTL